MGSDLAISALVVLLTAGGASVLYGLFMPRLRLVLIPGILGMGYITGIAIFAVSAQLLLVIGLPFQLAGLILAAAGITGIWHRRRSQPPATNERPAIQWSAPDYLGAGLFLIALLLSAVGGAFVASRSTIFAWDAWNNWGIKALMIHHAGGIDIGFLRATANRPIHPEYPLGLPALEAAFYWLSGGTDSHRLLALPALIVPAGCASVALIASSRVQPRFWGPPLAALMMLPAIYRVSGTGYADTSMAILSVTAMAVAITWLETRDWQRLILIVVLASGAAAIKTEGAGIGAVLLILLTVQCWSSWRPLVGAWAFFAATVAPWRAFTALHGINSGDFSSSGSALSPSLSETAWKIPRTLEATGYGLLQLPDFLLHGSRHWSYLGEMRWIWIPVALTAAGIVGVQIRTASARLILGMVAGSSLIYALSFWVIDVDFDGMIKFGLSRYVVTPILLLVCGATILCGKPRGGSPAPRAACASAGPEPDRS